RLQVIDAEGCRLRDTEPAELKKHVFRLVDFGSEIVGTASIGVEFLHQPAMRGPDIFFFGALPEAQHRQRLGAAHGTRWHWPIAAWPRLPGIAPARLAAIEPGLEQGPALISDRGALPVERFQLGIVQR